jgi:REP element-mobilizing transposase RayT
MLDRGHGACTLRESRAAAAVQDVLLKGHPSEYVIESFVIMPNHVHVVVTTPPRLDLSELLKTLKGSSSRSVNLAIGRSGNLWQPDYFDRLIRDTDHFKKTVKYVEWNPVKARLCSDPKAYRWSSAFPQTSWMLRQGLGSPSEAAPD